MALAFRPADAVETAERREAALAEASAPSVLALSRRALPALRTKNAVENLSVRGAHVLAEAEGGPRAVTLLGAGSEVQVAMEARECSQAKEFPAAVVPMPCFGLFDRQDRAYRAQVLGTAPRFAIDAASPIGWTRYVESEGAARRHPRRRLEGKRPPVAFASSWATPPSMATSAPTNRLRHPR